MLNYELVMALVMVLYKGVIPLKFVDGTPVCDHSSESFLAVLSCGTVYYAVQGGSHF